MSSRKRLAPDLSWILIPTRFFLVKKGTQDDKKDIVIIV